MQIIEWTFSEHHWSIFVVVVLSVENTGHPLRSEDVTQSECGIHLSGSWQQPFCLLSLSCFLSGVKMAAKLKWPLKQLGHLNVGHVATHSPSISTAISSRPVCITAMSTWRVALTCAWALSAVCTGLMIPWRVQSSYIKKTYMSLERS